jgi:hypothetical protein
MLASLPWIPVPGRGDYEVQPIHVDDAVRAIVALVEGPVTRRARVALVGPSPQRFDDFLASLRGSLGLGRARFLRVPTGAMAAAASLSGRSRGLLDRDLLAMLYRGSTADPAGTRELLGRPPRTATELHPGERSALRAGAQLAWLLPLLRGSVALVWLVTGVVSLAFYPVTQSLELLARAVVPAAWAPLALHGAAALDLFLGFASLASRRRPWIWLVQVAVILGYTLIISVKLPEYWAHPYGPVLKNLPMLAAIWLIYELERGRWNT